MKNYTAIFVSFKSPVCIKYRRSLYMTWDGLFGIQTEFECIPISSHSLFLFSLSPSVQLHSEEYLAYVQVVRSSVWSNWFISPSFAFSVACLLSIQRSHQHRRIPLKPKKNHLFTATFLVIDCHQNNPTNFSINIRCNLWRIIYEE